MTRLVEERLHPKLRTFAPALHAFCHKGDLDGALEVDAAVTEAKIEITEAEYAVLLAAYREAGRWDDAFTLLRRLRQGESWGQGMLGTGTGEVGDRGGGSSRLGRGSWGLGQAKLTTWGARRWVG